MTYVALERFADLQDGNHIYEAGESYPRPGFNAAQQRIDELAGSDNRMGRPLIADVSARRVAGGAEAPAAAAEAGGGENPAPEEKPAQRGRRSRKKG